MVTISHSPTAQRADPAGPGRHSTARSVVRSAGAFFGAAWRVVLFGGDFKH
jgi:hypothetical protein